MLHTATLADIRRQRPCHDGWTMLLKGLGYSNGNYNPDHIVSLADIARTNNAADAFWAIRCFNINEDFHTKLKLALDRIVSRSCSDYAASDYASYYAATAASAASDYASYYAAVAAAAADYASYYAAAAAAAADYASYYARTAAARTAAYTAAHTAAYAKERELQRNDIIEIFGEE